MGLAGQNAWHICAGEALPRGQREIAAVAAAHAKSGAGAVATGARWRGLLVLAERIGEETRLRQRGALLLFLEAAEKQVEQAFGRRRRAGSPQRSPQARRRQQAPCGAACAEKTTLYATLTPPRPENLPGRSSAPARVTLMRDGKRVVTARLGVGKEMRLLAGVPRAQSFKNSPAL